MSVNRDRSPIGVFPSVDTKLGDEAELFRDVEK
jgi:hypothetical protein